MKDARLVEVLEMYETPAIVDAVKAVIAERNSLREANRAALVRLIVAQQWAAFWAMIGPEGTNALRYIDGLHFRLDGPGMTAEEKHEAAMDAWDCAILHGLKYNKAAEAIAQMPCAVDVVDSLYAIDKHGTLHDDTDEEDRLAQTTPEA